MSGLAAGVNDTFRQAGIAVGVAALGALVPAAHAFGGDPQTYVDGMKDALWVGAALCVAGAIACAALLVERRKARDDRRARARRRLAGRGVCPAAPPGLRGWAARSSGTMPGT